MSVTQGRRVDPMTVIGLGLVMLPLLTMWHEIGGHVTACVALYGRVATIGTGAVLVGLLNPIGIFITIMSAAAASFGGNAGLISVGYAVPSGEIAKPFTIERHWFILVLGIVLTAGFAIILGPSIVLDQR